MDFNLKDEQRALQESVTRLLGTHYNFEARNRHAQQDDGWSRDMWARYAELGLLGLPFAEEHGGFGGDAADLMLTMEAFGRVMALEPYLATVVLAGTALRVGGTPSQRADFLPRIADGSLLCAWAHGERDTWHQPSHVTTTAAQDGDTWVLHGAKSLVLHGLSADLLVVSARVRGAADATEGIGLFLVPGDAKGLSKRGYRLLDQTPAAEITLSGVRGRLLGTATEAWPIIERVIETGIAAVCAQAVGAMQAALDLTVDYLNTRQQFGRPIGENQALQHRAAEMLIATEQARSMAMLAAMIVDDPEAQDRARHIAMAKAVIGREARLVGQQAIQLHGGIGMTTEYSAGHYLRHFTVIDQLFGDTAFHVRRLAEEHA
ncbi:acyl-CoA dehydrogenase family protein [Azoarcus sp. DN11]|uniref:acyl-CoA dehydrogenase family protein n=1 Tax=Azoarcus sp. DN11 TaxID=356837 RepID=UPI000EB1193F|nr:acyl-CoA dehydrogenase family protein [Azoarcus sp. DN11]AYH43561.1 pimeloyl-CoA dehydrogenase small subunit [Azoarcus sp. DN11]